MRMIIYPALALFSYFLIGCGGSCPVSGGGGSEASQTVTPAASGQPMQFGIADSPEKIKPISAGTELPGATLVQPDGKPVEVSAMVKGQPTVVIVYRGGWCPYCNKHLSDVGRVEPELVKMGFKVVAVSPDTPDALQPTVQNDKLDYQLLSDRDMVFIRKLGLAFYLDPATLAKYEQYQIPLVTPPGATGPVLPVPAVVIVDSQGVVRYVHSDPDYKTRLDGDVLVAEAKKIAG